MRGDEFFIKVAGQPPFSRMHPKIASFFKEYLSHEKVVQFQDRFVVNTHFPPYPSPAFENMVEHFDAIGEARRSLFSATLAVTNKCMYRCWHCYNAGRSQRDVPLDCLKDVSGTLQEMGAVHVTLTGGEPLTRGELEDIAASFDARTYLSLNTTGAGLTRERASALRESGVFALGVSLDSTDPNEHDRLRGKDGAFRTALAALGMASDAGLYAYVIAVATRTFLEPHHFWNYVRLASEAGAREIHLLEPCPTGKLAGHSEVVLSESDQQSILDYQKEVATAENLPILSSFLYLESAEAFGCGAGLTHLYEEP